MKNQEDCVIDQVNFGNLIDVLISLTATKEKLDDILQQLVNGLSQELNNFSCVLQCYSPLKIYYSANPSSSQETAQLILQVVEQISQETYTNEVENIALKTNLLLSNLTLLIFPLIYKEEDLGKLVIFQEINDYIFSESEVEIAKLIALHSAIAIYENQLETRNYYLKQETKLAKETAYISHELRTPISAIVGFSKMILKQIYGPLNDKQKDYISLIVSSGEYLLSLVNDLLDLFKLNAQKEELILTNINIMTLCHQVIKMVEMDAKKKKLDLILSFKTPLKTIVGDERRLTQILLNLLSNSIKFTNKGSITLKVTSEQKQIHFAVIDTGIGIKQEEQYKLFQPFQRLSNYSHQNYNLQEKGTGLGLALSQELAYLHGGKITCISELNRGSCFTLSLPIRS